jgi:dUTP pyrophosphatase
MKVKFKKLNPAAVIPSYGKPGDCGLDLTALTRLWHSNEKVWSYGTGLVVEIPKDHVGLVFPRSSIFKYDLQLCNSVAVIDENYRGELIFKFRHPKDTLMQLKYEPGNKIAQLIILPIPKIELEEVEELSSSSRGELGFGSSGT